MLLDQSKKDVCLKEIEHQYPELIVKAKINLSTNSRAELLNVVISAIKDQYFPSNKNLISDSISFGIISIALLPLTLALFPLWLVLYSSIANNLKLRIPEDCKNPELQALPQNQLDSLQSIIEGSVLVTYRDYETEAKLKAEAEQQQLRWQQAEQLEEATKKHRDMVDGGFKNLHIELKEAEQDKKYAEIDRVRAEKQIEKIKFKIEQIKADKQQPAAPNEVLFSASAKTTPIKHATKRFLTLSAVTEDHDGNPVWFRKKGLNLS